MPILSLKGFKLWTLIRQKLVKFDVYYSVLLLALLQYETDFYNVIQSNFEKRHEYNIQKMSSQTAVYIFSIQISFCNMIFDYVWYRFEIDCKHKWWTKWLTKGYPRYRTIKLSQLNYLPWSILSQDYLPSCTSSGCILQL